MRDYEVQIDDGPKPWFTGYSRDFRYRTIGYVSASRRSVAVKRARAEFRDAIKNAASWRVVA